MGRSLAPFFRRKGYRVLICDPAGRLPRFASADLDAAASADEKSLRSLFPGEDVLERGIADVLVATALAPSKNVARQKIREGAVATSLDGQAWSKVDSPAHVLRIGSGQGVFLRLGKRFVRVTP